MSVTIGSQGTLIEVSVSGRAPVVLFTGSIAGGIGGTSTGSNYLMALSENLKISGKTKMDANGIINADIPVFIQGMFTGTLDTDLFFTTDMPYYSLFFTGSDGLLPWVGLKWALKDNTGTSHTLTVNTINLSQYDISGAKDGAVKVSVKGDIYGRPSWV